MKTIAALFAFALISSSVWAQESHSPSPSGRYESEPLDLKLKQEVDDALAKFYVPGGNIEVRPVGVKTDSYYDNAGLRSTLAGLRGANEDVQRTIRELQKKCKKVLVTVSTSRAYGIKVGDTCVLRFGGYAGKFTGEEKAQFSSLNQTDLIRRQLALTRVLVNAGADDNLKLTFNDSLLWQMSRPQFDEFLRLIPKIVVRLKEKGANGAQRQLYLSDDGERDAMSTGEYTIRYFVNMMKPGMPGIQNFLKGDHSKFDVRPNH